MTEDLQNLLERIQKEGVDKAQAEAEQILAEARENAQHIVAQATEEAAAARTAGDREAQAFMDRAAVTLEQVARDYLLRVQRDLEALFLESVRGDLAEALTPELVAELVAKLVESYRPDGHEEGIDVRVSAADRDRFVDLFMAKYRRLISQGIEIHVDERIRKGFRVSIDEDHVFHDFTLEALAESVAAMLRPPLRDIVRRAAAQSTTPGD